MYNLNKEKTMKKLLLIAVLLSVVGSSFAGGCYSCKKPCSPCTKTVRPCCPAAEQKTCEKYVRQTAPAIVTRHEQCPTYSYKCPCDMNMCGEAAE